MSESSIVESTSAPRATDDGGRLLPGRSTRQVAALARYAQKQEEIITAATELLCLQGLKGFTLAAVAKKTGLITQGVAYYFPKRDDLAAACLLRTAKRLDALLSEPLTRPTSSERITGFLRAYFLLFSRMRGGLEPPMAPLDEFRVLNESNFQVVATALRELFRRLRLVFDTPEAAWMDRRTRIARTALLLQLALSVPAWEYGTPADHARSCERMLEILLHGVVKRPDAHWSPIQLPLTRAPGPLSPRDAFLIAATGLINEEGYRGASVEKISARLNVSKGAFYHHNDDKDDVVMRCFQRTLDLVTGIQTAAADLDGDAWTKITTAGAALARLQLSDEGPLLRTTAVYALPPAAVSTFAREWDRVSHRFAGMVSDGVAEGSIRPVDPFIAGQLIMAAINSSVELSSWLTHVEADHIGELYVRPVLVGLLTA